MQTNKLVDKLTFSPKKHKQKVTKNLRDKLQQKTLKASKPTTPSTSIKLGSFNINGLDLETSWSVDELLKNRGFDVNTFKNHSNILKITYLGSYPQRDP